MSESMSLVRWAGRTKAQTFSGDSVNFAFLMVNLFIPNPRNGTAWMTMPHGNRTDQVQPLSRIRTLLREKFQGVMTLTESNLTLCIRFISALVPTCVQV